MRALNLGILAHVDAGKTSLTERLLHGAGIVDEIGSVDAGSTHTDFLDLERQRGITIKAAVVSFVAPGSDVTINLIDTPGHPDFIAEVERALAVLDGAVLVISAVEGVQAQTRILMRTLQRLRLPTLLYVNKIDRLGAREDGVLDEIRTRLTTAIVPMGTVKDIGTRDATFVPHVLDPDAVVAGTKQAKLHPVFFGSAITGAGVEVLTEGITTLLPAVRPDADGPVAGTVFKVEHGTAFVRMFSGTLRVRDKVDDRKVTAIEVFERGATARRTEAIGGDIAKVTGLTGVRIGDAVGEERRSVARQFVPPTLETAVVPVDARDRVRLHTALTQLAEQDPLIDLRHDDLGQELYVSLYGEVQKEVIQATLLSDFGLDVAFRETTQICIERLKGSGSSIERIPRSRTSTHPFFAGIGLRVDPAPIGSGVEFRYEIELGSLPSAFMKAIADTVPEALRQGLRGWSVTDCTVTLTYSAYWPRQSHSHQGFSKAMSSIGSDFRHTTPLVLLDAVRRAGTVVCEPISRYELEVPADVLPTFVPLLARLGAPPLEQSSRGDALVLCGQIRAADVHGLQHQLPDLTRGEGVLETAFDSYRPVRGEPPTRPRTDLNPLNREEYLMRVLGVT
jgi:ribosomal protection tetracycline resistance protein